MSIFQRQFSIRLPMWGFVVFCILYGFYVHGLDAACRYGFLQVDGSWCVDTAYAQEVEEKRAAVMMIKQREHDEAMRQVALAEQRLQTQTRRSIENQQEYVVAEWQARRSLCMNAFRSMEDAYPQFVDEVSIAARRTDWNDRSFMTEAQKYFNNLRQRHPGKTEVGFRWELERYGDQLEISRVASKNPIVTWLGKGSIFCAVKIRPFAEQIEAIAISENSAILRLAELEGLLEHLRLPFDRQGDYVANFESFEKQFVDVRNRYRVFPTASKSLSTFLEKAIESIKASQAQTREGDGGLSEESQRVIRGTWADRLRALQN